MALPPRRAFFAVGLEFKYIPWNPAEKGGIADDAIDVDPLTFSTGLRFRF